MLILEKNILIREINVLFRLVPIGFMYLGFNFDLRSNLSGRSVGWFLEVEAAIAGK